MGPPRGIACCQAMARQDPSRRSGAWMLAGIIIGAGLMLAGVEVFHHVEQQDAHSGGVAPVTEPSATITAKPHAPSSKKMTATRKKHTPVHSAKVVGKAAAAASAHEVKKKPQTKKEKKHAVAELAVELKKAQAQLDKSEKKNFVAQGKTPGQILDWAQKSAPTDEAKRVVQEARGAVQDMEKAALKAASKAHVDVDRLQAAADKELAASETSTEFEVVSENADVRPLEQEDPPATWLLSGSLPSPMHNEPFGKKQTLTKDEEIQMKGEGFTVPDDISPTKKHKKERVVEKLSKAQEERMSPSQILRWAAKHATSDVAKNAVQNARKVLSKMHATASKAKKAPVTEEVDEEDEGEELIEEKADVNPNKDVVDEAANEAVEEVMTEETNAESTKDEADKLAKEESE